MLQRSAQDNRLPFEPITLQTNYLQTDYPPKRLPSKPITIQTDHLPNR
ncbi:MAG: hypothetical protein IPG55_15930 [Saprospiraceae bacterium]|nr:hypothetical protein [Candidatus Defluviibacterium haderslevense]MBK7242502.1 hypothetical protein [Candidatus Defluviibacterium haderslevense]